VLTALVDSVGGTCDGEKVAGRTIFISTEILHKYQVKPGYISPETDL